MAKYDPEDMAARGRIGGLTTQAKYGKQASAPATRGFLDKFLHEVDPEGVLSEEERRFRAEMALKAHMARLAYQSAAVRRSKGKAARGDE